MPHYGSACSGFGDAWQSEHDRPIQRNAVLTSNASDRAVVQIPESADRGHGFLGSRAGGKRGP